MEDYTYNVMNYGTASPRTLKRKRCHEETRQCKRRRVEDSAKPSKCTGGDSIITISSSSIITISSSSSSSNGKDEGPSQPTRGQQEGSLNKRATFEAKYKEQNALQAGGFGQVFAGLRRADDLPVAIKHIPKGNVPYIQIGQNRHRIPTEVAIMQRLAAGRAGSEAAAAPVALLDWYELDSEVILVMERPVPCIDLIGYTNQHGGLLAEEEAQVIVKQMLAALLELQRQEVFHRDLKLENTLIQTGGDVPRARLIDFGLSAIVGSSKLFRTFCGTKCHIPPECKTYHSYSAGPTTVWQLGVLAYEMLHESRFNTNLFLTKKQTINRKLSQDCQTFLKQCLTVCPFQRSTLQELQKHPWLQ